MYDEIELIDNDTDILGYDMIDMICIRCDCYDGHDKCLVDVIQAGFEHNQNSKDRRTKINGLGSSSGES